MKKCYVEWKKPHFLTDIWSNWGYILAVKHDSKHFDCNICCYTYVNQGKQCHKDDQLNYIMINMKYPLLKLLKYSLVQVLNLAASLIASRL